MLNEKKMTAAILKLLDIVAEEASELFEDDEDNDYGQPMHDICNAIAAKFQTVYQYTVNSGEKLGINYRGKDLFDQRACLICREMDVSYAGAVMADRVQELWLLEDMSFAVVDVLGIRFGEETENCCTEYRAAVNTVEDADDLCFEYESIMDGIEEFANAANENPTLYAL